jgi:hypothetical protein
MYSCMGFCYKLWDPKSIKTRKIRIDKSVMNFNEDAGV